MEQLYVGVGREDICPKIGTKMGGYAPARPALGIHDPIHATAFVFSYGQTRALLLSAEPRLTLSEPGSPLNSGRRWT